jgi:hypothetical protein
MACPDPDFKRWTKIPPGSTYELSVSGPAVAFAKFDDAGTALIDTWTDIAPGPHVEPLGPRGVHTVFIFLEVVAAGAVEVKATVRKPNGTVHQAAFCHTVAGGPPTQDVVQHDLEML